MLIPLTASSGNRYSMPVGNSRAQHRYSMGSATRNGFNVPINTSFLDDTDGDYLTLNGLDLKSPTAQTLAQLQGDDTFPTLTSNGSRVSHFVHFTFKSNISSCLPTLLQSTLPTRRPPSQTGALGLAIVLVTRACLIPTQACIAQS